jgi:protein-disulfide isomerase
MMRTLFVMIVAALSLAGCKSGDTPSNTAAANSTTAAVVAPAGTVWSEKTSATPEGGMVMGNPNAPVKLIEYGALSCPVCAKFSNDGHSEIRTMVDKGTLSFEFRPFLVHGIQDVPATLIARCNGDGAFFTLAEQLYATQDAWLANVYSMPDAEKQSIGTMQPMQAVAALSAKMDMVGFAAQRGIGADKAKACLSDAKAFDTLQKITSAGMKDFGVGGTPTFIINGVKAEDTAAWEVLKPKLLAAGA